MRRSRDRCTTGSPSSQTHAELVHEHQCDPAPLELPTHCDDRQQLGHQGDERHCLGHQRPQFLEEDDGG